MTVQHAIAEPAAAAGTPGPDSDTKEKKANDSVTVIFSADYDSMAYFKPVNLTYPNFYIGIMTGMDSAAQMAVDEINQSDEILPSFRVNVVRLDGEDVMRKGGALGALALYNFLAEKRPLAVFSMATSWNSRILTQIASNNNIAVCLTSLEMVTDYIAGDLCRTCIGTVPDSKTLFTNIVTYLKSIKVRRVVMLYQDSFYKTGREGLREQLNAFKIRIDADYPVPDTLTASSRHQIVQYLLSVNARYILCIMSPDPLADLYFFSRKYDLVSPRNVWISIVPPIPESKSLSELYGDGAEEDLQGFVYVHQESQVSTSPAVRAYVDEYLGRSRLEPTRYVTAIDGPPVFSENAYDCIKMLLYGFDRLSRQGNASIQDLVSTGDPLVRATDVFSDPGFDGVTQKRLLLDKNGLILQNTIFFNINASTMYASRVDRDQAFGGVGYAPGSPYEQYRPQIFYGGSTVPPPDGAADLVWLLNSSSSVHGILSIIAAAVGVTACALSALMAIRFRRDRVFVSTSALFAVVQAAGLGLVTASGLFSALTFTPFKCKARLWFQLGGFSLLMAAILVKNVKVYLLLKPDCRFKMNSAFEAALFCAVVLIEVALLLAWSFAQDARPVLIETLESVVETCVSSPNSQFPGKTLLYVYNCLLLLAAFQATRIVRWNERRYTDSSIDNAMTLASLTVATVVGCLVLPVIETAEPGPARDALRYFAAWMASAAATVALFGSKAGALRAKYVQRTAIASRWSFSMHRQSRRGSAIAVEVPPMPPTPTDGNEAPAVGPNAPAESLSRPPRDQEARSPPESKSHTTKGHDGRTTTVGPPGESLGRPSIGRDARTAAVAAAAQERLGTGTEERGSRRRVRKIVAQLPAVDLGTVCFKCASTAASSPLAIWRTASATLVAPSTARPQLLLLVRARPAAASTTANATAVYKSWAYALAAAAPARRASETRVHVALARPAGGGGARTPARLLLECDTPERADAVVEALGRGRSAA